MSFGILTSAIKSDYLKAIGLSLSLRVSNPGVPLAIVCPKEIKDLVAPYFSYVVDEDPSFKGFEHKVNIDRYSPFEETLFLDSDILVFRDVKPFLATWGDSPYAACGHVVTRGISCFGLDIEKTLKLLGKNKFFQIEGVGHGYFRKPSCNLFFEKAREVTKNYKQYAGNAKYADEDAVSIVMTMMDYKPAPWGEFFANQFSVKSRIISMDAVKGRCTFIHLDTNKPYSPCTIHFSRDAVVFQYTWQLYKLFKNFNVPTEGLFTLAMMGYYREVRLTLHAYKKSIKSMLN